VTTISLSSASSFSTAARALCAKPGDATNMAAVMRKNRRAFFAKWIVVRGVPSVMISSPKRTHSHISCVLHILYTKDFASHSLKL
jgi:hypothetical protein